MCLRGEIDVLMVRFLNTIRLLDRCAERSNIEVAQTSCQLHQFTKEIRDAMITRSDWVLLRGKSQVSKKPL